MSETRDDDQGQANRPVLGYRSGGDERRQPPYWAQALIGFLVAALGTAVANFAGGFCVFTTTQGTLNRISQASVICLVALAIFAGQGLALRQRGRWPGFLPGVLAGWGVAALVEGVCFVNMNR